MLEGKRINDRYKIMKMIGGGGMSNVYLAHDIILNRDVAIKVMRYDFSDQDELQRRFQREALSATSLTHPNIVDVYDVGDEGNLHYIVMEYVKGKTLKQYIQEYAPISPARSVYIMKQLTSAIAHAHDNEIIHRDIKPQNILMDENGDVKITDFGIAMTLSATALTQTNSVLGTVHYLSPEQARGSGATHKSDIYALGIVLYELLTGELPFSGESAVSIALMHLQSETPSVRAIDASIPQSLENVVLRATAKDPFNRYASVEAMHEDLTTVLSPARENEAPFHVAIDDDETKAMPVIKDVPVNKTTDLSKTVELDAAPPVKDEEPSHNRKRWRFIIIGLFIAVAVPLIAALLFSDTFQPKKSPVPDVTGLSVDDATKMIEEAGFLVGDTVERHDSDIEEGKIIETSPKSGTLRMKNADIDLIISKGEALTEMPDYTGRKYEQLKKSIDKENFKSVRIEEEYDDTVVAGVIITQDPMPGKEVTIKDTDLVLTVSKGQDSITVADLTGYNNAALENYAQSSGLKIHVGNEEHSDNVQKGNVIRQSPQSGSSLAKGSTISVTLSKGPAAKPTKTYIQTVDIPYEVEEPQEQEDVEGEDEADKEDKPKVPQPKRKVLIYVQDKGHTMADPLETLEINAPTKYRVRMEVEQGQKASFRIISEGKVIAEETIAYDDI